MEEEEQKEEEGRLLGSSSAHHDVVGLFAGILNMFLRFLRCSSWLRFSQFSAPFNFLFDTLTDKVVEFGREICCR